MGWAPSLWLGLQIAGQEGKGCFLPGWKQLRVQGLPGGPGPFTYNSAPPSKPFQEEAQMPLGGQIQLTSLIEAAPSTKDSEAKSREQANSSILQSWGRG